VTRSLFNGRVRRTRLATLAAVAFALVLAVPAVASAPRSGALHVTKNCIDYHGLAGDHCTITSSNVKAIPVGSTVVYTNAPGAAALDTDLILQTRGANSASGHVVLDLATGTGTVTFHGGSGQFEKFQATVEVTPLGGFDFAWDGTYSYE
jgi:hypothetical protein